jgi:hypothetical protein
MTREKGDTKNKVKKKGFLNWAIERAHSPIHFGEKEVRNFESYVF